MQQRMLHVARLFLFFFDNVKLFAFQAPSNMKSVLQAGWLLTVAFGNVIVLIVAEGAGLDQVRLCKSAVRNTGGDKCFISKISSSSSSVILFQWKEFVLFAGLLLGVCIIFSIMASFYTYVDPEQLDKVYLEDSGQEEDDGDKKKKKNSSIQMNKTTKSTRL